LKHQKVKQLHLIIHSFQIFRCVQSIQRFSDQNGSFGNGKFCRKIRQIFTSNRLVSTNISNRNNIKQNKQNKTTQKHTATKQNKTNQKQNKTKQNKQSKTKHNENKPNFPNNQTKIRKQLHHIREASSLLFMDKKLVGDPEMAEEIFGHLNAIQIKHILQKFKPDEYKFFIIIIIFDFCFSFSFFSFVLLLLLDSVYPLNLFQNK
jgi:hypothetical protein